MAYTSRYPAGHPKAGRPRPTGSGLAEEILRASTKIVLDGEEELSLRSIALATGTSHKAPHKHFPGGITEIVAGVAAEGFDRLTLALNADPVATGEARIRQLVARYVEFGVDERHSRLYRVMYSPQLIDGLSRVGKAAIVGGPTYFMLVQAKGRAYAVFVEAVEAVEALRPVANRPGATAGNLAKAVTSLAHGLVGEFIDEGLLADTVAGEGMWSARRQQVTTDVTNTLLHGLIPTAR